MSPEMQTLDVALGTLACLSLWWRRQFPLAVALLAVPAQALSTSAIGAGIVIVRNLALRVPRRRAITVLCVLVAAALASIAFLPGHRHEGWVDAALVLAYYLVFFAWGSAIHERPAGPGGPGQGERADGRSPERQARRARCARTCSARCTG